MLYVQVGSWDSSATFSWRTPDPTEGRGGAFGDGAVLSAPPPHHSWVATVFGLFVTGLYLDSTEKKRRAIPQTVRSSSWNHALSFPVGFCAQTRASFPLEANINKFSQEADTLLKQRLQLTSGTVTRCMIHVFIPRYNICIVVYLNRLALLASQVV